MKLWDSVTTQLFSVHQPCARFLLRKQFLFILRFSQSSAFLFKLYFYLFIFLFWLYCVAYGILVP